MFEYRHNAFNFWSRRFLAAAAVMCACVLFAPQHAAASCGDYVIIKGKPVSHGSHTMASEQSRTSHEFPTCHGPGCRQKRERPSSPPTRVTLEEHSWSLLSKFVDVDLERDRFFATSHQPVVALFVATGVFRPPRLAAAV